jgi:hypothetical protein
MSDQSRMSSKVGTLHSFRCARCGEIAATIDLVGSGPVAAGPGPLGDEIVLDVGWTGTAARQSWIGSTMKIINAETAQLLADDTIDPLTLNRADGDFGRFCCSGCELVYCSNCWTHWRVRDNISGRCPEGHEQWLDYN